VLFAFPAPAKASEYFLGSTFRCCSLEFEQVVSKLLDVEVDSKLLDVEVDSKLLDVDVSVLLDIRT
jgi:hypothetical protein